MQAVGQLYGYTIYNATGCLVQVIGDQVANKEMLYLLVIAFIVVYVMLVLSFLAEMRLSKFIKSRALWHDYLLWNRGNNKGESYDEIRR